MSTKWTLLQCGQQIIEQSLIDLVSIIDGFGSQINELVPTYANLIKDSETEVKIAALEGLDNVIKFVNSEKVTVCIIPALLSLSNESSIQVKCNTKY